MKRQISSGIILSFVSQGINIIVGLAYTPVMIRLLGQNEYGLYQLVQSVVNYLNLMNFGFSGAYIRYYSIAKATGDEGKVGNINGMFLKAFLVISAFCVILGIVLLGNIQLLGTHLTVEDYRIARILLIIMVGNMAISFPSSLFTAYINANEQFAFSKGIGIIFSILVPICTIPLLLLGKGSIGVVSVSLMLAIVSLVVRLVYCFKKLKMKINFYYFDKAVFKSLMGFTFFIFLSDIVDQLNLNVDKLLLGRMKGTIAVAIYSVGFSLKSHYTAVSWVVPEMFVPQINRIVTEEKDDKRLTLLFSKVGRINNYVFWLVMTGFVLIGREFIYLWVGAGYETSYYATIILIAASFIPSVQTVGVDIQNAKNMHRVRSIVYFVIACLNVVSSIFLIKIWGVVGTCLGTLFATTLGTGFFMNYYYKKYIGLDIWFFWKEIIRWAFPAVFLFALAFFIRRYLIIQSWFSLLLFIVVYSLAYTAVLWKFGLKKYERQQMKGWIVNRFKIRVNN